CSGGEDFDEAQSGTAAPGPARERELVGDGADDRDAEASLGERLEIARVRLLRGIEPSALVVHLDRQPIAVELVRDLDRAAASGVRVADRVRCRLREREL